MNNKGYEKGSGIILVTVFACTDTTLRNTDAIMHTSERSPILTVHDLYVSGQMDSLYIRSIRAMLPGGSRIQ